jgi:hypothetical protein
VGYISNTAGEDTEYSISTAQGHHAMSRAATYQRSVLDTKFGRKLRQHASTVTCQGLVAWWCLVKPHVTAQLLRMSNSTLLNDKFNISTQACTQQRVLHICLHHIQACKRRDLHMNCLFVSVQSDMQCTDDAAGGSVTYSKYSIAPDTPSKKVSAVLQHTEHTSAER